MVSFCAPPSNATCFLCVALQQAEPQEETHLCVCPAGICVAEPVQVSVSLPLSVDIPLPYQVVRGEQVELSGSVYNQHAESVSVLTAHVPLSHDPSQPERSQAICLHSTA